MMHFNDFGVHAEHHFYATSHGKSACDGIGGSVKRAAKRASLSNETLLITSATEMYEWIKHQNFKIDFCLVKVAEYNTMQRHLNTRFKKAVLIPGTQSFHTFIPCSSTEMMVKKFSSSEEFEKFKLL